MTSAARAMRLLAAVLLLVVWSEATHAQTKGITAVATNAALKAISAGAAPYNSFMFRAGYYAAGDGGDALYVWNGASTCADDGGSCIVPSSAPSTGRWLLNQNGAPSIKVFGGVCDGNTNDVVFFNAALAARSAVYIPAKTTCAIRIASPAGGLVMSSGYHLYGENEYTSELNFIYDYTPSYNFVSGGRLYSLAVASNVASVQTGWSHEMQTGNSITIAGSPTAGLNGTYTITLPTDGTGPDHFTFPTSGVANNTYAGTLAVSANTPAGSTAGVNDTLHFSAVPSWVTAGMTVVDEWISTAIPAGTTVVSKTGTTVVLNHFVASQVTAGIDQMYFGPAGLTGPSGIGADNIYSVDRDNNDGSTFATIEIDHLFLQDVSGVPGAMLDMTNTRSSSIHELIFYTAGPGTGKVGIVCADVSPGNLEASCFFNNFWSLHANLDTFLHQSARYGNSSVNTFTAADGYASIVVDTTGSNNAGMHSVYLDWYFNGAPTPNSWDMYGAVNGETTFASLNFEGFTNSSGTSNTFAVSAATSQIQVDLPFIKSSQGISLPATTVAGLPPCTSNPFFFDAFRVVTDAASPTYNGTLVGGGAVTVPVFCNGTAWVAH
jgi:hypothetical protein